jgi:DNA-binding CsgD family transcriptional regulator
VNEQAERLLPLIFDVPGNPLAWSSFFAALEEAISPEVRVTVLVETTHPLPTTTLFGIDMQHVAAGLLPRRSDGGPRLEALAEGAVFELPRLDARMADHPVVRQLLGPAGLQAGPGLCIALTRDGPRVTALLLVLPRRKGWKPSAADRELLSELAPYLAQAARLHDRLAGGAVLTSLLDHLVLGVILLDDRGHVSYTNRSAADLLGVAPGLADASPGGARDARTEALYRGITPDGPGEGEGALYRHPADGRPLHLLHADLDWSNGHGLAAQRFRRALFIGDPKQSSGDPTQTMGSVYGFTPGEAKLAWLLVGDFSLAEAASQLCITQSTARTVLKRILAKTGARRQASLVRLLLSGPGQLRDDAQPSRGRPPRAKRRRP